MSNGGGGNKDLGLLVVRVGLGGMYLVVHGLPKLMGGPERWERIGGAMAALGIMGIPKVWGLAAALTETLGGLAMILGLWMRPLLIPLIFTMVVAGAKDFGQGGILAAAHAIEDGLVLIALLVTGTGKYALGGK